MSGFEIAAGRRDDAHVDADLGTAAQPLEFLLDQDAQDLALGLQGHVGDFIDVERARVGFLQRADLAGAAPVFGAEQFLLDAIGRHGRRIEHDERPVRTQRLGVHDARRQFLARARHAADQDAAVGRRDPVDGAAQLVHDRGLADHVGALHRALAQFFHFALET